jgi:hypothetical protein
VSYVVSTSGIWSFVAATHDLFGSGDYTVHTWCGPDDAPQEPQNCISQYLLCGQTAAWNLTNQSCRFSNDATHVYSDFAFYGVAGDFVQLELISGEFSPILGVYDEAGSQVTVSSPASSTRDVASFTVPKNGMYDIVVTSKSSVAVGFYTLSMKCSSSGCLTPYIRRQPLNTTVPWGSRATLEVPVDSIGPMAYSWYDARGLPLLVAQSQTYTTPPITAPQSYYLVATSPCGSAQSRAFTLTPQPSRSRAVRHK